MRSSISATVLQCYLYDPLWWNIHSPDSVYDHEGYDCFGYNTDGFDREGYAKKDYEERPSFDEEDNPYDEGGSLYLRVLNQYGVYTKEGLALPTKGFYGLELWRGPHVSWVTEQGLIFADPSEHDGIIDMRTWLDNDANLLMV